MSTYTSKYSIEIVDKTGQLLADFSGRAGNRRIVQSRNEAEDIQWSIDLNEFERYCRLLGQDSRTLIIPDYSEVRIKRGNSYLCGGEINFAKPRITNTSQTVDLRASGFLNMFKDRYTGTTSLGSVTESFTNETRSDILATLITETQALTNGDYGVTIGTLYAGDQYDKTYEQTNIKDAIKAFGDVQAGSIDHEFTYDKVFNTYNSIGSNRPDVIFEYPKNITQFELPNDGTNVANQILALGQGFGDEAKTTVEENDNGSQLTYILRQKIIVTNGTDDSNDGITQAAEAEITAYGVPYEIPTLIIDGNKAPYVTDYSIGDSVKVIINGYNSLEHINGMYRIEKRIIDLDEMDNETITLMLV